MPTDKLNKTAVRKEARGLLRSGMSRQEVYETLADKYLYGKEVADIVRYLPSAKASNKYGNWNAVLLVIVIVICGLAVISSPGLLVLIWSGVLIYGVATQSLQYYVWVSLFAGLGMVGFVAFMVFKNLWETNLVEVIGLGVLLIPMLILPIWLEKKLCPKPQEHKETYVNENGLRRIRVVYTFKDI